MRNYKARSDTLLTIRMALNAARRKGLIPTNPAEAVELPEAEGTERGTFTAEEVPTNIVDLVAGVA